MVRVTLSFKIPQLIKVYKKLDRMPASYPSHIQTLLKRICYYESTGKDMVPISAACAKPWGTLFVAVTMHCRVIEVSLLSVSEMIETEIVTTSDSDGAMNIAFKRDEVKTMPPLSTFQRMVASAGMRPSSVSSISSSANILQSSGRIISVLLCVVPGL